MAITRRTWTVVGLLAAAVLAGCAPDGGMRAEPEDDSPGMVIVPTEVVACLIDASKIRYVPDAPGKDYWQSPEQTETRGQGDCEDISIYLQDLLRRKGIEVEVVFGLKSMVHKHGHCWCEYRHDGKTYVIESRTGGFYDRAKLSPQRYVRADDVDVVAEKVRRYHDRTGVWINEAYRKRIEGEPGRPAATNPASVGGP